MNSILTKTVAVALLPWLAMPGSAAGRTVEQTAIFCVTASMDAELGHASGFVDAYPDTLTQWLITPLRDALYSIDRIDRPMSRFFYKPASIPACTGVNAIKIAIRYSGKGNGRASPIEVRTEIHVPVRPDFKSSRVSSVNQEIASGRVVPLTINNTEQQAIFSILKSEAGSIARWILAENAAP